MKKYYNLINGLPCELPNPIIVTISNPNKNHYEQFGYHPKELIIEDEPEYNTETQYLECYYEETEDKITKKYRIKEFEIPNEEDNTDGNNQEQLEVE